MDELSDHARLECAELSTALRTEGLHRISAAIREAEETQRSDAYAAAELSNWAPSEASRRLDGVPAKTYPRCPDGTPFADRDYAGGARRGYRAETCTEPGRLGVVALLSTRHDTLHDWLRAGQALQRVLLCAAAHRVQAAFHSQPLEVPRLREELHHGVTLGDYPQMILRLGYVNHLPPTPLCRLQARLTTARPTLDILATMPLQHRLLRFAGLADVTTHCAISPVGQGAPYSDGTSPTASL